MEMTDADKEAAEYARKITASAIALTDKLIDDLGGRSGFSLDADVRRLLRDAWIILITTHLVDNQRDDEIAELRKSAAFQKLLELGNLVATKIAGGPRAADTRFARPIICAWCGNRHRSIVPSNDRSTQGDGCAASVYQATEFVITRVNKINRDVPLAIGTWIVQGHYGSNDYDARMFRFVQNPPSAAANPVCDNCIGERAGVGDLEVIEGDYPW